MLVITQLVAAFIIFSTAKNTDGYDPAPITVAQARTNCPLEYNDYGAGGLHLSRLILDRLRYTVDLADKENFDSKKESPETIPTHVQSLNSFFCQGQSYH